MSNRHKFIGSLITILKHNKDGSYRTQNDRSKSLIEIAKQLYQDGYQLEHIRQLKPKHVWHLVEAWKAGTTVGSGSMKNRMSHIRWLMQKIGKENSIPGSNDHFGIPKRQYVTGKDKSRQLTEGDLDKIKSERTRLILKSQELFGLRLEESLKLQPFICDLGQQLHVFKTKGGRERYIPIRNQAQRQWLDDAKVFVKNQEASLIPPEVSYIRYRRRVEKRFQRADINKVHGHRHLFAHRVFEELTGFPCPAKGGPKASEMTKEQRELDKKARILLSHLLGHSRRYISSVYL